MAISLTEKSGHSPGAYRQNRLPLVSGGDALSHPDDDRLGYSTLALELSRAILALDPEDCLTMGVYGASGAGKTTMLNFVLHYLHDRPEEEQPVLVEFNPSWFSGYPTTAVPFLAHLQTVISGRPEFSSTRLAEQIATLSDLVSGQVTASPNTVHHEPPVNAGYLRQRIGEKLRNQSRRVVVVMDDVDRLDGVTICHLFQLLKGIAHFPNFVFLLGMDPHPVIHNLRPLLLTPEAYLDEVVQIPVALPAPDKTALRRILNERLEQVLGDTPDHLFHPDYWRSVYLNGIDHLISRPRDVRRLASTLAFTYPVVRGKVNFVDYVAIESIRIFFPTVYELIRKNPGEFAGQPGAQECGGLKGYERNAFHESWMRQIPEELQEPLKVLLMSIFPKLRLVWRGVYYAEPWETQLGGRLADCDADALRDYFCFAIPEGSLSTVEMKTMLALCTDPATFGAKLVELSRQPRPDGTTRLRSFLERFLDQARVDEISPDWISPILIALFDVGDQLINRSTSAGRTHATDAIIIRSIITHLLRELPETDDFQILRRAIQKGRALATIVDVVANVEWMHGRYNAAASTYLKDGAVRPDSSNRLISPRHLEDLQRLVVERLRQAASSRTLLGTPDLKAVLGWWRQWGDPAEVEEWLKK